MNQFQSFLLKPKIALDAPLDSMVMPDRAEHQQHSDPDFTTQTGKDYAGRNSTEFEHGLDVTIPPKDLHIGSKKTAKFLSYFGKRKMKPTAEDFCWVYHPSYGVYFMEGIENYHFLFFKGSGKGNKYTEVIPYKLYDDCNRGYAYADRENKNLILKSSSNVKDYLRFVPDKVVEEFKSVFPGFQLDARGAKVAALIETPEFEMSASGIRRVSKSVTSEEWDWIQDIVNKFGYSWLGQVSDGTELWGKKREHLVYDPATKQWALLENKKPIDQGSVEELEDKISLHNNFERPALVTASDADIPSADVLKAWMKSTDVIHVQEVGDQHIPASAKDLAILQQLTGLTSYSLDDYDKVLAQISEQGYSIEVSFNEDETPPISFQASSKTAKATAKPKCPHCGSTDYGLMPTDFETAKCNECGKQLNATDTTVLIAQKTKTKTAAQKTFYHVTYTSKIPKIQTQGILPFQTSNWTKGQDGKRYGEGEIYACDNLNDAVRWAAKMDWEFYQQIGSGKISIVIFIPIKDQKWEHDTNDPIHQLGNKGHWLKWLGSVKPEQIQKTIPVTAEMIRAVVKGQDVNLDGDKKKADIKSYGKGADDPVMDMTAALEKIASSADLTWWAKSARPTDQKIQLLTKQLNLTPEQIELCIQTDPSPQQKDFVATIAKWLSKKLIKLPEDSSKIRQQLDIFNKLKKSPKFDGEKDIQKYNPDTLFQTVERNSQNVSKKEKTRQDIQHGSEIVVQDGDLTIYKVVDAAALMQLSGGTNWCTAHRKDSNYYLKRGPSYIFFKDNSAFAQLHPSSNQLMNRQDLCMVKDIQENGEVIAKFVDDPTALRGLQLLAAKEPEVATWVKENASDPATIVEILSKKRNEELESGVKTRDMSVLYAIAKGEALPPAEEANLNKQVPLEILMRYGQKFHAGQPWAPLEKAVIAEKDVSQVTDYALEFVRGRWKPGEKRLLGRAFSAGNSWGAKALMAHAIDYALRVLKGRWAEFETKLHTASSSEATSYGSLKYAVEVLKQPWRQMYFDADGTDMRAPNHEEQLIYADTKNWNEYSKAFFPKDLWDEFERTIAPSAGLDEDNFRPDLDLWIVRSFSDLANCIYTIGNDDANSAMDYALEAENETGHVDIPSEEDMVSKLVGKLSITAMRRIGQSLQEEKPTTIQRWAKQQGLQQIDYTDWQQLRDILLYMGRYSPECSVWKNIVAAYTTAAQEGYKQHMVDDLSYNLDPSELAERNEEAYTELRYGNNFAETFDDDWKIAPVYEVLGRWGASRMLSDNVNKDISGGMLELYQYEPDMSGRDDAEAYELMDEWYTKGQPRENDPNQMQLQFKSHLLKKGLVQTRNARRHLNGTELEKEAAISKSESYQADAYIEWGGQYDHRRLELDEYKGIYEWTDYDASDALNLGTQIGECTSLEEAKTKLEQAVFSIGEPNTYIHWEDNTSIKKQDYLRPSEKKFLQDVGVNQNIKPLHESSKTVKSNLLKRQPKKALVDMHKTPELLPPRDDARRHLDETEQTAITDDVRKGINPNISKPNVSQIDPRLNPDGVVASAKIVKWRVDPPPTGRFRSFHTRSWPSADYANGDPAALISCEDEYDPSKVRTGEHKPLTVRIADWSITPEERARTGAASFTWRNMKGTFATIKEAQAAVAVLLSKHPELHPEKTEPKQAAASYDEDMQVEYQLDQIQDAEKEAKRHFMQEEYIQQLCDDFIPPKTMDELWEEMGEEYTAEFYGYPYKRVQDFTDQPTEGWEGKRVSSEQCPICKSANVSTIDDDAKGYSSGLKLSECYDCRGIYTTVG